jgi:hypothetical protein
MRRVLHNRSRHGHRDIKRSVGALISSAILLQPVYPGSAQPPMIKAVAIFVTGREADLSVRRTGWIKITMNQFQIHDSGPADSLGATSPNR